MTRPGSYWRWVRVLVGAGLILLLIQHASVPAIAQQLSRVDGSWLLLAGGAILLATLVGAFNLYILIAQDRGIPLSRFFPAYWTSWAVGLVVPGQVGDVASITLLLRRHGYQWAAILGRSLLDKLISLVVLLGFTLWALAHLLSIDRFILTLVVLTALGLISGVLLTWLMTRRNQRQGRTGQFAGYLHRVMAESVSTIREHPRRVSLNLAGTFLKIVFTGASYWCIFRGLGHVETTLPEVIPLVAGSSLVAYIPISFNGLGTAEAAGVWLFSTIGIPAASVIAGYLMLRLLVMGLAWLPAGLWLLSMRR